jgi:hypothetical protein
MQVNVTHNPSAFGFKYEAKTDTGLIAQGNTEKVALEMLITMQQERIFKLQGELDESR